MAALRKLCILGLPVRVAGAGGRQGLALVRVRVLRPVVLESPFESGRLLLPGSPVVLLSRARAPVVRLLCRALSRRRQSMRQ